MPGFLTHYLAGQALIESLDDDVSSKIKQHEQLFSLGTQGPDIFFYYVPGIVRKHSRGIGSIMHNSDLGIFLSQMATIAKKSSYPNNQDIVFAYTAGFVMHYALDVFAHPYVYAMTEKDDAPKIKNSAEHRKFETAIDVAMLKLIQGSKPGDVKQHKLINANTYSMNTAADAFMLAVYKVYDKELRSKHIRQAMRHMAFLTRLLQSKSGKRKRIMASLESFTVKEPLISSMVHMQALDDSVDYLNLDKKEWSAPWSAHNAFTDSFLDRYHGAVAHAAHIVSVMYEYVYGEDRLDMLESVLENRSLKTGLEYDFS